MANRIEPLPEDIEWARRTFAGRLGNDRSKPRLDWRAIDPATGEIVGRCNDLVQLGKAAACRDNARQKSGARCASRKLPAQPDKGLPAMLALATPCPDGQMSQHVVLLWEDRDWEVKGVVPRPGGAKGRERVELIRCRYEKWAESHLPRWRDEANQRGWLNAAAYNVWRQMRGWLPMIYKPYAEKHLLWAFERENGDKQLYCVPCDASGNVLDDVYVEIARGRRIEITSWDQPFESFDAAEPAAA